MSRIDETELLRLKRDTDLAALVQSHGVVLQKHGSRDLVGRCPFHEEETPSFVVTPSKNLFHCLGCGAAGGPIDFVMRTQNLDFRAAVDAMLARGPVVRRGSAVARPTSDASPTATEVAKEKNASPEGAMGPNADPAATPPAVSEERIQVLLERVVTIYAQAFAEVPAARDYLRTRGLGDQGLLARHRVGLADGRLPRLLPTAGDLFAELRAVGVLLDGGRERFENCVVFPIFDEAGRIATFYGRTLTPASDPGRRHVFLPDRPQGLWNVSVLKSSSHAVLVESVLDALSVITAGVDNVLAVQGTNGLGADDVLTLRTLGVQRVTLCLDGDAAGRAATERLKEKLTGFALSVVTLPEGEDPNSFLMHQGPAALASLLSPSDRPNTPAAPSLPAGVPLPGGFALTYGLRRYEVRGLEQTARSLKATIRVERAGRLHVDTLDLYAARSRRQLSLDLARVLEEPADVIEGDLAKLLTACEAQADNARRSGGAAGAGVGSGAEAPALSAQDKEAGEALARDPRLIDTILADFERCGLVGERANKLLMYLAMTSRKMARPLAVLNLSSSGAGKTALQDGCLAFCPPEDLVKLTTLSGKALFYKERDSLKHKVLALEEGDGVAEAMYALRNLISAGELVTESTIKDPSTGRLITMANKVEGPTAVFLTTTNPETDPETKSRFFVTSVDESREQTEAILAYQRRRYTLQGLQEQAQNEAVLRRHHTFQRVLAPVSVVNPFAEQLSYGDSRLPGRRDQPKYLGLINAIAFLRQRQKAAKHYAGKAYVEVDREDIRLGNALATELLGHSLEELSRPGYELLQVLYRMRGEWAKTAAAAGREERAFEHFYFSRRQVREFSGWAHARVQRYLGELVALEYAAMESGRNGVLHRYALLWDGSGQEGGKFLLGLKRPEELREVAAVA